MGVNVDAGTLELVMSLLAAFVSCCARSGLISASYQQDAPLCWGIWMIARGPQHDRFSAAASFCVGRPMAGHVRVPTSQIANGIYLFTNMLPKHVELSLHWHLTM